MKKGVIFLFVVACTSLFSHAQQVVPAGGHLNKKDVSVEWIIAGNLFNNVIIVNDQPENKSALVIESDQDLSFKVYPSLTKDFVTVEINANVSVEYQLDVFNALGAKVMQKITFNAPNSKIDLSSLISGMYFLKISELNKDKVLFTQKVVKL